jgi:hypothetical protein
MVVCVWIRIHGSGSGFSTINPDQPHWCFQSNQKRSMVRLAIPFTFRKDSVLLNFLPVSVQSSPKYRTGVVDRHRFDADPDADPD